MQSIRQRTQLCGLIGITLVGGLGSIWQTRNGVAQTVDLPTLKPLEVLPVPHDTWQFSTTATLQGTRYNLTATNADARELLAGIARQANRQANGQAKVQILVSDDVRAIVPSLNVREATLPQIVAQVATAAHLSWGLVGTDTFLVVRGAAVTQAPILMQPLPQARILPRILPRTSPPSDWSPRQFNGQTYYVVPVAQSTAPKTADTLPVNPAPPALAPAPSAPAPSQDITPVK